MTSPTDHLLAARTASDAGRLLLELRAGATEGGERLGRTADRSSHELLVSELGAADPSARVLSEEADTDDPSRLDAERVWIIDPLDGTREYTEPGRDDWAVHVALVEGGQLVAGAVALPARAMTLSTGSAAAPPVARRARPVVVVSRSRPPAAAAEVARSLGAELRPMGSAGAKAMAVVLGEADAYVHAGGQYEWDSAAPVAVAAATGLHTSRLDGSPLRYNQRDPWLPDLVVCRPELADRVLAAANG
ncbi:MAG: 3'(2'),5'-bisphosphate nucleotidase CysQ [Acidimicrobiales bacterium]